MTTSNNEPGYRVYGGSKAEFIHALIMEGNRDSAADAIWDWTGRTIRTRPLPGSIRSEKPPSGSPVITFLDIESLLGKPPAMTNESKSDKVKRENLGCAIIIAYVLIGFMTAAYVNVYRIPAWRAVGEHTAVEAEASFFLGALWPAYWLYCLCEFIVIRLGEVRICVGSFSPF